MSKDKPVSKNKFKKEFTQGKDGYVKKPNSWKRTHIWWEPMKDGERWFINIADDVRVKGKGTKIEESCWINSKGLDIWLNDWENRNYKFYLNE